MPIARLNFRRHFLLLACALVVSIIVAQLDLFGSASLLPNAAVYGALHAIALTGALDVAATLRRKSLFIVLAAALDVVALYLGIIILGLLSTTALALGLRAYAAFGSCATAGALCYGLLIRHFWLPHLSPRPIARIALGCLIATLAALLLEHAARISLLWALAAVWWFAFSGGLWSFERARRIP